MAKRREPKDVITMRDELCLPYSEGREAVEKIVEWEGRGRL